MESEYIKTYDLIPHMTYYEWFYILTSGGLICLKNHLRSKKGIRMELYYLIPHIIYCHWFYFSTSKSMQILEVTTFRIIWGQKRVLEWNQNTKISMIWYLTLLIFIDFILWPPKVCKFWRSQPSGSSEVKKGYQNGIGIPKNLW